MGNIFLDDTIDIVYAYDFWSLNEWVHVAAVYNSTTLAIYVNGTLWNSTPNTGSDTITGEICIGVKADGDGCRTDDSQHWYDGYLDEFIIWNGSLSSEQLTQIYQAGIAGHSLNNISSDETNTNENWTACVTPSDGYDDGTTVCSNDLITIGIKNLQSMVGNSTNWTWNDPETGGQTIRSGTPYNWTWRLYESGSGRQIINGTAINWTWIDEY